MAFGRSDVTATRSWTLWCDHDACKEVGERFWNTSVEYGTLAPLRTHALAAGWTTVRGQDFCPTHSGPVRPVKRLPRGQCPRCPAERPLSSDGTLRAHRVALDDWRERHLHCTGAGLPPRKDDR